MTDKDRIKELECEVRRLKEKVERSERDILWLYREGIYGKGRKERMRSERLTGNVRIDE